MRDAYSSGVQQPLYIRVDADGRIRMRDLLKRLIRTCLPVTTDQKVQVSPSTQLGRMPRRVTAELRRSRKRKSELQKPNNLNFSRLIIANLYIAT
jgi:hypothetical protein